MPRHIERAQSHGSLIESRTDEQRLARIRAARPRATADAVEVLLRALAELDLVISGADGARIVERVLVAQLGALASQPEGAMSA